MKILTREYKTFYEKLAYRHAPINYQYVDKSYPRRDMICKIDYDGDWDTSNNRRNINKYDLIPVCYYSIAESRTHYYILYTFYHADDLTHENDLEGCLLILDKREEILGMISVAHNDFYSYVYDDRLKGKEEDVDGRLYLEMFENSKHVMIKQEDGKHGLYAWGNPSKYPFFRRIFNDSKDAIGICYYPSTKAVMPKRVESFNDTRYGYILIDIASEEGFWHRRLDKDTFKQWGVFNSSTISSANAPWIWNDWGDNIDAGLIFFDPAYVVSRYFKGFESFDTQYIKLMNQYK